MPHEQTEDQRRILEKGREPDRDATSVKGWGQDADPRNDPTYPMKKRTDAEQNGYSWKRPPLQETDIEVLRSNERINMPAVFGTAAPPSGLSGVIRRYAFNYSESSYRHWIPLMVADRVNMVEGVLQDLARGHVPNVFAERGWGAEWRYNRKALVTKCAAAAAVGVGVALLVASRRSRRR